MLNDFLLKFDSTTFEVHSRFLFFSSSLIEEALTITSHEVTVISNFLFINIHSTTSSSISSVSGFFFTWMHSQFCWLFLVERLNPATGFHSLIFVNLHHIFLQICKLSCLYLIIFIFVLFAGFFYFCLLCMKI